MGLSTWTSTNALIGAALAVVFGTTIALYTWARIGVHRRRRDRLMAIGIGAMGFQLAHFAEHFLQLGYWILHPAERPWLTPWAEAGANGLGLWCSILPVAGERPTLGAEVLHLVGNTIFLLGIVALVRAARLTPHPLPSRGMLRLAVAIQSVHLVEHLGLTASVYFLGRPLGMSTLYGLIDGTTSGAFTYRIWWHFLINLAATTVAVVGARRVWGPWNIRARLRRADGSSPRGRTLATT